ncbi:hypothetical protein JW859_14085 [bacterium]|nr:hypothetical protein [bacterium]
MSQPERHECHVPIPEYLPIKREFMRAGLVSCSQQGFNIAFGPLTGLREGLATWMKSLEPADERWLVPALIRRDWVEYGIWNDPPAEMWCTEQPGGHLLTPRPLFHLLNRLRHHPSEGAVWLLEGQCTRNEDAEETLPLKLQRSFYMFEYIAQAPEGALNVWMGELFDRLWHQAVAWDLPVDRSAAQVQEDADRHTKLSEEDAQRLALGWRLPVGSPVKAGAAGMDLRLRLGDGEAVRLARGWLVPEELTRVYGLGQQRMAAVSCGLERWCLAILARYGANANLWPQIPPGG